jgi:hypothetical protein
LSLAIVSSLDPQLPSTQLLATPRNSSQLLATPLNSPQLPFPFSGMTTPTGLHTDTCMYLSVSTDVLLCPLPSATNAAPGPVTCPSLLLVVPPVRLTPFQNPRTVEPPQTSFPPFLPSALLHPAQCNGPAKGRRGPACRAAHRTSPSQRLRRPCPASD